MKVLDVELGNLEPISGVQCFPSYQNGNTNPAMSFNTVHKKTKGREKEGQTLLLFFSFHHKIVKFSGFWTQTDKILKIGHSSHTI